ncbi:MAG: GH25 family lysozyme [Rhizobiaceae bacterium]
MTAMPATATDFVKPWLRADRALVIDAYEYNPLDWGKLAANKRIAAFINKGSDGLPPAYRCSGDETERRLCKALWKRYSVARELFHTRKSIAKSLGLKWGAYHVARPGNPIDQANHFLDFAEPGKDDLMALDLEGLDPEQWMSLEDAEIFARHIRTRTGRYPVLYANDITAQYIADNRDRYRLLSRLPLWYARYRPSIGGTFPKGYWNSYALWQFSAAANCNRRRCPYRVAGARNDIDVNVAAMDAPSLRRAWPFGRLVNPVEQHLQLAQVPVPVSRKHGLSGEARLIMANVAREQPHSRDVGFLAGHHVGTAEYMAFLKDVSTAYREAGGGRFAAMLDGTETASVRKTRKLGGERIRPAPRTAITAP